MARTQYDLTIIGGGSGGLTAARVAASLGANVLLIDKEKLGGDCLNFGCVPSKSLIHVARVVKRAKDAAKLGLIPAGLGIDMTKVSNYVQGVIRYVSENEQVYTEGVIVKFGRVSFVSPTELSLNDERVTTRATLIATGSHPLVPPIEGLAETGYWTNADVFDLTALPRSLIVAGGGPIGVELGQAFSRLGVQVTIIQGPERILPREDPEASALLAEVLTAEEISVVTNARVMQARREGDKKVVVAKQGEQMLSYTADEILIALGRRPNVDGLNLEAVGVKYDQKGIGVDEHLQTSTSNILAIGDVIGGYLFTHVAAYQAGVAVRSALLPVGKKKVDYRVVPWCTFTDPEVARVGLTPEEAQKRNQQVRIVTLPWGEIDRAQAEGATAGFIKLVLAGKKDEIVGVHMVGASAGELLGEMSLAMRHRMTLSDIYNTIHAYPTLASGIQQAAFEAYLEGAPARSNRRIVKTILSLRG